MQTSEALSGLFSADLTGVADAFQQEAIKSPSDTSSSSDSPTI